MLPAAAIPVIITTLGTVFSAAAHDRHNPDDTLACIPGHPRLDPARDYVVAHRTLPCRTPLLVCLPRTGRCVGAIVGDRGPRRAGVDLAPAVARALGHDGREDVVLVPMAPRKRWRWRRGCESALMSRA